MTLSEITTAMQTWASMQNPGGIPTVQSWLNQGNYFPYLRDENNTPAGGQTKAFVHAYPGIYSGQLVFFVISAYLDNAGTANIEDYVEVCAVGNGTPSATSKGGIPITEALGRIQNWSTNSDTWIADQINSTTGLFRAFNIPHDDTATGTNHEAFFALAPAAASPNTATADLIIEDLGPSGIIYMDTINPVPPFPPTPTYLEESAFYLLTLV